MNFFKHPTAVIDDGAEIGENTKIWHFAHVRGGAKIGRDCIVGKGCYIDTGVSIGDRCKIQNLVSVYNGVTLEEDVFVGPHAVFTNDLKPRAFGNWEVVYTFVKKGASIGANATIVCGIEIGSYAMIGAGAVVTKPVPPHGLVIGVPARLVGYVCKCGERIADANLDLPSTVTCPHCGEKNRIE